MVNLFKKSYLVFAFICWGWLLLIWLWPSTPYLLCFDDSFYYFEIARNVAKGFGLTFDRINLTNGFHPLWLIMCIPVYKFGFAGLTAVRILLSLQILIWFCVCWVIEKIVFNIVSRCSIIAGPVTHVLYDTYIFKTVWLFFALIAASPFFLRAFVNGLESAVCAIFNAILLWQTIKMKGQFLSNTSHRRRLIVGSIGALCFLARTDAVLLLICLGCCCLLEALSLGIKALGCLTELFVLPAAAFILFSLFNYVTFGSSWQVSGELKRMPLTTGRASIIALGLIVSLMIGWLFKNWGKLSDQYDSQIILPSDNSKTKFPCLREFLNNTWWFALFCCLIIMYYTVMQAFPQLWYFGPILLYVLCIFLFTVIDLFSIALTDDLSDKTQKTTLPKLKWVLTIPLLLSIIIANLNAIDPRFLSICIANQRAGEWISENLPQSAILGSWDAGVVGYFTTQKVINIDGVVNSIDYMRALKEGKAGELLRKQGLGYFVNHDIMQNGEAKDLKQLAGKLFDMDTSESLGLVKRWPFTFRGSTNRFGQGTWEMAVFLYRIEMTKT